MAAAQQRWGSRGPSAPRGGSSERDEPSALDSGSEAGTSGGRGDESPPRGGEWGFIDETPSTSDVLSGSFGGGGGGPPGHRQGGHHHHQDLSSRPKLPGARDLEGGAMAAAAGAGGGGGGGMDVDEGGDSMMVDDDDL